MQMSGTMHDGGNLLSAETDMMSQAESSDGTMAQTAAKGSIIIDWGRMLFLRLSDVQGSMFVFPGTGAPLTNGQWYRIPLGASDTPDVRMNITPDPELLRAQAAVVAVTRDHGIEQIHGGAAHRYDVTIDRAKLEQWLAGVAAEEGGQFDATHIASVLDGVQASGELWIDADSFVVHRVQWSLERTVGDKPFSLRLSIDMTDHNRAPAVLLPEVTQPLSLEALLLQIFPSALGMLQPPPPLP